VRTPLSRRFRPALIYDVIEEEPLLEGDEIVFATVGDGQLSPSSHVLNQECQPKGNG
jgi:hypothetical protein